MTRYVIDITKNNISNNKPQQQDKTDNQQVFECLINTVHETQPQITKQTHSTIQDLKFGIYSLVVWSQTQLRWQSQQTQPTLAKHQQIKTQPTK